jgi:hypothetical protein
MDRFFLHPKEKPGAKSRYGRGRWDRGEADIIMAAPLKRRIAPAPELYKIMDKNKWRSHLPDRHFAGHI